MQCAYHPRIETVLRCGKCEKPICGRCTVITPVGARCKECARSQRLPTYTVTPAYLLRGAGAGLAVGLAAGVTLGLLDSSGVIPWSFRWLFHMVGLVAAGYLTGEAVSVATNRKRGPFLQGIAVAGFLAGYLVFELLAPGLLIGNFYTMVGFIVAVAIALGRLR